MARQFEPGRVAQHGFEYQKLCYYYLIESYKSNYCKFFYEGLEDLHFESSNGELFFIQAKTASLSKNDKKAILINWLSISKTANKYMLITEKTNELDVASITEDVISDIKSSNEASSLSNLFKAYSKYSASGSFDEVKLRGDIKNIKNNLVVSNISANDMFLELQDNMKKDAENFAVIDMTIESRVYHILTMILLKIHKEYNGGMNNPVEITLSDYNNLYFDARIKYPAEYFDEDYVKLKNGINKDNIFKSDLREVIELKKLNLGEAYIVDRLIDEVFYKKFRDFYINMNYDSDISNVEEEAYQNYLSTKERNIAKGNISNIDLYFESIDKPIRHQLIQKVSSSSFCSKGCYIFLTSNDADDNKQITWEMEA